MSGRTTRSRAAKITLPSEQPKISDTFKVSRRLGKEQTKKVVEQLDTVAERIDISQVKQKTARGKSLKRIKTETEVKEDPTVECSTSSSLLGSAESKDAISRILAESALPAEHAVPDSPPHRARKTPTPNTSPISANKSSARKALFPRQQEKSVQLEIEDVTPIDVDVPSNAISNSQPAVIECPVITGTRVAKTKIKTVAQLQAELAQKGAVRRIHEQNMESKSRQVVEHAQLLKSPQKVPAGIFVPHTKTKTLEPPKTPKKSELSIPEYVLPSFKTPSKQQDSDDERETLEKKRVFEYGKAARLLPEIKDCIECPLPPKYQTLLESFQSCDRIVSIFTGQGRRCVLENIQQNVQRNTCREFKLRHMAQILNLFPTSYNIRLDEKWEAFGGTTKGKYEHVIAPNLTNDLTEYMLPESPKKAAPEEFVLPAVTPGKCLSPMKSPRKKVAPLPRAPEVVERPRLEGWRMTCRSHVLRYKLVELVKSSLEKLGLPVRDIHPDFDKLCPEIEQAVLPEPPRREKKLFSMKDYMDTVDDGMQLPKGVDEALNELKSPVKSLMSTSRQIPLSPKKFAEHKAAKPKGAMSLLERIRAKEAAAKALEARVDPVAAKLKAQLEMLRRKMIRTIDSMFTQRNCKSMVLGNVVEKIEYNNGEMTRMSKAEITTHLEVLCDTLPDSFIIKTVTGTRYFQISYSNYSALQEVIKSKIDAIQPILVKGP